MGAVAESLSPFGAADQTPEQVFSGAPALVFAFGKVVTVITSHSGDHNNDNSVHSETGLGTSSSVGDEMAHTMDAQTLSSTIMRCIRSGDFEMASELIISHFEAAYEGRITLELTAEFVYEALTEMAQLDDLEALRCVSDTAGALVEGYTMSYLAMDPEVSEMVSDTTAKAIATFMSKMLNWLVLLRDNPAEAFRRGQPELALQR